MQMPEEIKDEVKSAIDELGMRVKNELTPVMREDETLLYRFLKARDFDVDKAEKFLRKNITWRKVHQMDNILQNFKPTEFYENYGAPSCLGFDKDGDILLYHPTGLLNAHEFSKCIKVNNFILHFSWFIEKMVARMEENNKKVGKQQYRSTLIFDLDKLTFRSATCKFTLNLFLRIVSMYQNNYPERLKYIYFINSPSYSVYPLSFLKNIISSVTRKKFRIFDSNGWKESLLEFIDPDILPAFLGGNRTDPDGDPLCRSLIIPKVKIPERLYLKDRDRYFQSDEQVQEIVIPNREQKEINVFIEKAGLLLEWEFFVRNKDIGFGLTYKISDNEMQEVIPVIRYDTSDGKEKDSYKCPLPGTYVIIFDNSFSWLSSKTVQYCINIQKATA